MLSVVKGCVRIPPCLYILPLISLTDGIELMIIIVATFAQAVSGNGEAVSIIGVLVVWRFLVSRHPFIPYSSHSILRWVLVLAVITL